MSYLFNLIVVRAIPVDGYGEYSTALSYYMLFSVPLGVLSIIVIRKVGSVPENDRYSFGRGMERWLFQEVLRKLPFLMLLMSVGMSLIWWKSNLHLYSVFFIASLLITGVFFMFYQALIQGYKNFLLSGTLVLTLSTLKLLFGIVVWIFFPFLIPLYVAVVLAMFGSVVFGMHLIRNKSQRVAKVDAITSSVRSLVLKKSVYLPILTIIGLTAIINLDVIFVKKFFSAHEAGLFAAVSLLGKIILYISAPVSSVAYSFFTGHETQHQSKRILYLTSLGFFLISVVSILGYKELPELVIQIILGQKYAEVSNLIWLAALFGSLYTFVSLYSQYWLSQNSLISATSLPVAILQFIGLSFFHSSFLQVLVVNSICTGLLLSIYFGFSLLPQHNPYEKKSVKSTLS